MNPFEFVLSILLMVFVFSIIRHKLGIPVRSMRQMRGFRDENSAAIESAETVRLREEVKALKDRIQVLERIATDRENSLSREIDALRDR